MKVKWRASSLFAIAVDNSGNHVPTSVRNLSFTKGSNQTANISITSGLQGFDVNSSDLTVVVKDGIISSISLLDGVVGNDLLSARIELFNDGNGSGAVIEPIIQQTLIFQLR